jgi:GNAT superfamily N-acetyltransferase
MSSLAVTTMTADEVELAVQWAADEGWNPGLGDAASFRAADPDGFLIGRVDGRPAATISAVRYPTGFAFLGLFIVRPELRGRGLGRSMWAAAMERMADDVVGLDGVVAQQGSYARSGFVLAHRSIRYGGTLARAAGVPGARDLADHDAVRDYDRACFGAPRPRFLSAWLSQAGARVACVVDGGSVRGYGVLRPCRAGSKVGPLFADDREVALALLSALGARLAPSEVVYLDVPEPNARAVDLARWLGMSPVFETARMYRGADPGLPLERVYGITSFELG